MKAILFDLDGTLLPITMEDFGKVYFTLLINKGIEMGIEKDAMKKGVMGGLEAMVKNDGSVSNEEVFWRVFKLATGKTREEVVDKFTAFYNNEFLQLKTVCKYTEYSKRIIDTLKNKGYRIILATNPILPMIAAENRMAFVDLKASDFEYITAYENSTYCKPNVKYYEEILEKCNLDPSECMMVGNNVLEDMIAEKLGVETYLITDVLENENNLDYSKYPQGTLEDFYKKVCEL